ncbi:TlpA family protein disulfide reductase [Alicyclobacillus mengziensis]|uniref:TlpA family protein disulfide reductase n=1 Tax=Alicyclobacillus mengziensis TaxID=2931921 RepID=A0A9X7VWK1_9BACL|nr:TlpA disulfide reductase family protein [Alicyclobacillus mengziensis]QSO46406.1 TlpA family protein disulfide reductase [Alicyclobacillus mengziensis]
MKLGLKWTSISAGVAILMAIVLTASPKVSAGSSNSRPYPGYIAPAFTLSELASGTPVSLSEFQGKPIFINFWASWCPPCQAETPDIVKAYQQYGNQVTFISINLTSGDSIAGVHQFVKRYGIKYPVLLDKNAAASTAYNVLAIPTSLFVNRNGVIVARFSGAIPAAELSANLQRIETS